MIIAQAVLSYFRARSCPLDFKLSTLDEYVWQNSRRARSPESAGRILRQLRQKGYIEYVVVNRARSHYKLLAVHASPKLPRKRPKPVAVTGSPYDALLEDLPLKVLRKVYRLVASETHPDHGGDAEVMAKVNAAWRKIQTTA